MAFPEQVEQAAAASRSTSAGCRRTTRSRTSSCSAWAAAASSATSCCRSPGRSWPTPVVVCKSYEPPSFAGPTTLCIALSYSGDTEETVEAAQTAALAGARMVVVARGGELAQLGRVVGRHPHRPARRHPDAAGRARRDGDPDAARARARRPVPRRARLDRPRGRAIAAPARRAVGDDNPARSLARRIGRTIPIIYGAGALGTTAALRWKNEINENAKSPAFIATVPGADPQRDLRLGPVRRRHPPGVHARAAAPRQEHPQVMRRFELVRKWTEEVVAGVEEVRAEGDGPLAQLLDLDVLRDGDQPRAGRARRASTPARSRCWTTSRQRWPLAPGSSVGSAPVGLS